MKTQWMPWLVAFALVGCQLISGGASLEVGEAGGGVANGGAAAGGSGPVGGGTSGGAGGVGGAGGTSGSGGAAGGAICSGSAFAARLFGGSGIQIAHDIAPLPQGGCIVVGETNETFDALPNNRNSFPVGFALRVDEAGDVVWAVPLDPLNVTVRSAVRVAIVNAHSYVLGRSSEGGYVAELSLSDGSVVWDASLIGATDGAVVVNDLAVDDLESLVRVVGSCTAAVTATTPGAASERLDCSSRNRDGFVVALSRTPTSNSFIPVHTRRYYIAGGDVEVRAVAVRADRVAMVGHADRGVLLSKAAASGAVETALWADPGSGLMTDGFVTTVVETSGDSNFTRRMFGAGDVKAVAVAIASANNKTRIAVGGSFANRVTMEDLTPSGNATSSPVLAGSVAPHGFVGSYNATGELLAGPEHLGEDENVQVLIRAVHIPDDDQTRVIVGGKFRGTLFPGLKSDGSAVLEPFVVSKAGALPFEEWLHIPAQSIGDDGGFGMRVDADGRLFVAARLDTTWELGGCCEVTTNNPSALVVTAAPLQ